MKRWLPRTFALASLLVVLLWALPALAQQAGSGRVAVVKSDDQSYPTVSLFLDVADANGAPVAGLAPANFTLLEDGQPATIQAVTTDSSQPLALLLALDRSTDATTWAAVQGAAATVINALGPQDQVAITTVFEQVQTVVEFTVDKNAALAALAGITPGGQFSAINPAFVDAIGHFNDNLPARRAIILVADAPDNISTVSADDVIAQVTGRGTPIYVVGYGDRVQSEPTFTQIATATGGRFFPIGAANDLQTSLTALVPQLRQGYRVDFVSQLVADNAPHAAQVQVIAPNVSGTATAQFVARATSINVTIPGLEAGQPVAGVVNLQAAAAFSGTVANVEFRVDGEVIGTAPNLNTPVVWDTSTLTPGPHELAVTVTDTVGNKGEATVQILIPESAPRLDLLTVDATLFPKISTYVDAFGNNGLPLAGLNAQSFTVSEDNQPLAPAQLAVNVDATQPLNLVLLLDRSVPVADWAQLRNAANNLVDALRPQDQMAIYAFAAGPTLVQGITGDKSTLKSALATVEAQPPLAATTPPTPSNDNGLHQAILDGSNLAATFPAGRRAVVVVTNGPDNTGQVALSALISALQGQQIPVHLLAFGVDGQSAGTLAAISQMAGGNSIAVNSATDIRSALQTLMVLLQQGYRLDFTSTIKADNSTHNITVALAASGLSAEASGEFIATSRPITVSFPNVEDGSTVSGALNLTAQAVTPAPITSVIYKLNGDTLAEVADTTFSIVWNSDTVEPGAYTVDVEVTDAAGNTGAASVSFTVVAPVTVMASLAPANSDGDITLGDDVGVKADVTVFSGRPSVEFQVDGETVGNDNSTPFEATFATNRFGAGNHTITVIARDDAGHEATSLIDFAVVLPPTPTPEPTATPASLIPSIPALPKVDWGRILRWAGILLLALIALFTVLGAMGSTRRNAAQQKLMPMRLTLSNLGNVATGYLLRGDDPSGILNFRFSLNGVALGLPPVARLTEDGPATSSASLGGRTLPGLPGGLRLPNLGQTQSQTAEGEGGEGVEGEGEGVGGGGALGKLDEASAVAKIIADILSTVTYFLPASLARPIRLVISQIRRGQTVAGRVKYMQKQVDRLNKSEMGRKVVQGTGEAANQVGRAATSDTTRGTVAQGASRAGAAMAATATAATRSAANRLYNLSGQSATGAQVGNGATNGVAAAGGARQWVYLPPVAPGETVTIDVMVGTNTRSASGNHQPFRLLSRALGDENAQPVIEEGSIRLAKSSPWPSILRMLLAIVVVLIAVALIWLLASTLF